jgi:hypothetical protein
MIDKLSLDFKNLGAFTAAKFVVTDGLRGIMVCGMSFAVSATDSGANFFRFHEKSSADFAARQA